MFYEKKRENKKVIQDILAPQIKVVNIMGKTNLAEQSICYVHWFIFIQFIFPSKVNILCDYINKTLFD